MRRLVAITACLVLAVAACTSDASEPVTGSIGAIAVGTPAPEFSPTVEWLNAPNPVQLADLRGTVTLVHFWRSSCLNCLEALPEIETLRSEFGDDLAVVGVHSPKFPRETDPEVVRTAVQRHEYPAFVINDRDLDVWGDWGIQAWPTVAIVDHEGNLAGGHVGLGAAEALRPQLETLVTAASNEPDGEAAIVPTVRSGAAPTVLSFPEAVLADPAGNRLFIADTGHHRIVIAALDSHEVLAVLGDGTSGGGDGPALTASFASPRGMALDATGSTLYVADTGNHVIRSVDVNALEVATIAGTGQRGGPVVEDGSARETGLTAPWDLEVGVDGLVVTLAGVDQVVLLDLDDLSVRTVAGSDRQANEFATPTGVGIDSAGVVYVADAESSSIRRISPDGGVKHLAGGAETLFEFGDEDGIGAAARLQRPQGIAVGDDTAWVADTYNSKIKRIDLQTGEVETLVGGEGWRDGPTPLFSAPADIDLADGLLYVADRDNHSVRIVDAASGATSTVILEGIERLVPDDDTFDGSYVALDRVEVAAGPGTVVLDVTFPSGYKANELAPSRFEWLAEGDIVEMPEDADRSVKGPSFPLPFEFAFLEGEGRLQADVWLVYCETVSQNICLFDRARFDIPLQVSASGSSDVQLTYEVTLPDGL